MNNGGLATSRGKWAEQFCVAERESTNFLLNNKKSVAREGKRLGNCMDCLDAIPSCD